MKLLILPLAFQKDLHINGKTLLAILQFSSMNLYIAVTCHAVRIAIIVNNWEIILIEPITAFAVTSDLAGRLL